MSRFGALFQNRRSRKVVNLKFRAGFRAGALIWLVCFAMVLACAQSERPVAINIGGGFTPLIGDVSSHLNSGWHMTGGVGYNVRGPLRSGCSLHSTASA